MKAYKYTGVEFHHTREDVDTIACLVKQLPANAICVNIGSKFGTSTMAMLEARDDIFIFSVDVNVCDDETINLTEEGLYQQHRLVRVLGRSQDAGLNFPISVDFVFVDGAHDYRSVRNDITVWWEKLKAGGIMALDDYGSSILCPWVKPAVDDLFTEDSFCLVGDIIAFRKDVE